MGKRQKKHKYLFLTGLFWIINYFDRRSRSSFDKSCIKKILLVTTTALGDTLLSTPAIRAVRKNFPNAHISVLVHKRTKDLLKENPFVDELIIYNGKFKRVVSLLRDLRKEHYDCVIVLHANDPDIVPLVYLSGAPHRIGWKESRFSFLLTNTYERPQETIHLIRYRLNILRSAGIVDDGTEMDLVIPGESERSLKEKLSGLTIDPDNKVVGLHPFASFPSKEWPSFNVFLKEISEKYPEWSFVVIGGSKEKKKIESAGCAQRNVFSLCGELTLLESAALIKRCSCFVSTDSGPLHMALALKVPSVVLRGSTDISRTGPLDGGDNIVIKKEVECNPCDLKECGSQKCMYLISSKEVIEAVEELVNLNK